MTSVREPWIGPNGQRTSLLELHLTYTCPQRCDFCSEAGRMVEYRDYPITWDLLVRVVRKHARRGVRKLHLTGGEPTVHSRLVDLLALARKLGMRTSLGTNGTLLSREEVARPVLALTDEVVFSLHAPDADLHDAVTGRPGSFGRVTRALELAGTAAPNVARFVNTVVTRRNIGVLAKTVGLAVEMGAATVLISNVSPEGSGLANYEELAVPLVRLAEILPEIPRAAGAAVVRFFGTPMCLLGSHWRLSNDLHWDPRVTVEWQRGAADAVLEDIYSWGPDRGREHAPECDPCVWRGICAGVFTRYTELWPTRALKPCLTAASIDTAARNG